MKNNLKYILCFGIVTIMIVVFVLSLTTMPTSGHQETNNGNDYHIKEYPTDDPAIKCYYVDYNGIFSDLSCIKK